MSIQLIQHNSEAYQQAVALRDIILRKPLGRQYSKADLEAESDSYHVGYYEQGELIGCLTLKPLSGESTFKMRQVAVSNAHQGKGVGRQLVEFSERFSQEKGTKRMSLHAREVAVPFYLALDYKIVSEKFEEVGLPHFKMEKILESQ